VYVHKSTEKIEDRMWNAVRTVNDDKVQQIWGPNTVGHEPTFSTYDRTWKNMDMEGDSVSNLGFCTYHCASNYYITSIKTN